MTSHELIICGIKTAIEDGKSVSTNADNCQYVEYSITDSREKVNLLEKFIVECLPKYDAIVWQEHPTIKLDDSNFYFSMRCALFNNGDISVHGAEKNQCLDFLFFKATNGIIA